MQKTTLPIKDDHKPIPDLNSVEHRGWNLKRDPDKKLAGDRYFTGGLPQTPQDFLSRRQSRERGFLNTRFAFSVSDMPFTATVTTMLVKGQVKEHRDDQQPFA